MDGHDEPGRERLVASLAGLGVPYELFACDPGLADTVAFCEAYGFDPDDSANTMSYRPASSTFSTWIVWSQLSPMS